MTTTADSTTTPSDNRNKSRTTSLAGMSADSSTSGKSTHARSQSMASSPAKSRKTSILSSMRRRLAKPFTADRHSCLAAPYGASDPRTVRFFELVISKAGAPVVCANAGKLKGKAIYADRELPKNARIWTEPPYVAMQHEQSRRRVPCCQYCFVPLLSDYKEQWTQLATQWNEHHVGTEFIMATPLDLDEVLRRLQVERHNCGLASAAVRCQCGDVYCSKLCQIRAYHEFHAILCPRGDAFSAMSMFVRHTTETNDIFLLAAKVIARVLCRFLVTQDLVKARESMDMFHKKPWWEVVMMEKHIQRRSQDGGGSGSRSSGSSPSGSSGNEDHESASRQRVAGADEDDDGVYSEQYAIMDGSGFDLSRNPLENASSETRFLKDLLVSTHQLLLDALESNLVHLEREDQLRGHGVNEIWTSCASILSFEFFAAQLGLFEMNNIHVEIDHPFRALMEVLDTSDDAGTTDPSDRALFERVQSVLSFGEGQRMREQLESLKRDDLGEENELVASGLLEGYPSIDGTALFSIICTMNHSCDPNCTVLYTKNGDAHVVAVRDIAKGEELCICYIDIDQDVREREVQLKDYQFLCLCPRCIFERRQSKDQKLVSEAAAAETETTTATATSGTGLGHVKSPDDSMSGGRAGTEEEAHFVPVAGV